MAPARPVARRRANRAGLIPVRPELVAAVRFFGRYRTGWIRGGVLLSAEDGKVMAADE